MTIENQHFVPKAYLRNFSTLAGDEIFGCQFIQQRNKWSTPKAYGLNSICSKDNFYNLTPRQVARYGTSTDYVERHAFWYERNFLPSITAKMESGIIDQQNLLDMVEVLLSIKQRNPKFRSGYNRENVEKFKPNILKGLSQKLAFLKDIGYDLEFILNTQWDHMLSSEHFAREAHNDSILTNHAGVNEVFSKIRDKLLVYKVMLFKILEDDVFFLTSDNPGFSIDKAKKTFSTKYINDMCHIFPLSSKLSICFLNPDYASHHPKFSVKYVDQAEVLKINVSSALVRDRFIYSCNFDQLSNFINIVHNQYQ